uniref:Uncharacterized protein n=1 Tax=mine drainage metagenome TaxID=410659 RepID=E6PHR7_9ZZZZ
MFDPLIAISGTLSARFLRTLDASDGVASGRGFPPRLGIPGAMERPNASEPRARPNAEAIDEPRWHASLAAIGALILYVLLPQRLVFGPAWFAPIVVLAVLVPLSIFAPDRDDETKLHRIASIVSIVLLNIFNVLSVILLVIDAFSHHPKGVAGITGQRLLLSGAQIWTTNVLVYALWFWEVDGGGPWQRTARYAWWRISKRAFCFHR